VDFCWIPSPEHLDWRKKKEEERLTYPLTIETERLILEMRGNPCTASFFYIMTLKDAGTEIGYVGIEDGNDLWLKTFPPYRNKGYMKEALKAVLSVCYMDMNLTTGIDNIAVLKLAKDLKLRYCGQNNGIVAYKYIARGNNHGLNR